MVGIKDFYRGDTQIYTLNFTDNDNNPIDLTGAIIWFTMKENINDTDENAAVQKEITDIPNPQDGKVSIVLNPSDTNDLSIGSYFYDFQLKDASGNITTVLSGKVKILPDVTRSIS